MNKVFCVSCGSKLLYEVSAPKFCSSCGNAVNSFAPKAAAKPVLKSKAYIEVDEDEDDGDCVDISNIDLRRLRKDIVTESFASKITLQDIIGTSTGGERFSRPSFNGPDGEDLINQTRRECGPSRPTDIDE